MIKTTQEILDEINSIHSQADIEADVTAKVTAVVSDKINAAVSEQLNAAIDAAHPELVQKVTDLETAVAAQATINTDQQNIIQQIADKLTGGDVVGATAIAQGAVSVDQGVTA